MRFESQEEVVQRFRAIRREMAAFQTETLMNRPGFEPPSKKTWEALHNDRLKTRPSGFPEIKGRAGPKSVPVYAISLRLRFVEFWTGGIPFGGPGPWLFNGDLNISFGMAVKTWPAFYEISDYGVPATEEHYNAEMRVRTSSPALENDVRVDFSIETTDLTTGLASGSFLTGTYILPANGATSNVIAMDTAANYGLRALKGTHTATVTLV